MTAVFLLARLREFIENCTKDIMLDVRPVVNDEPVGYDDNEQLTIDNGQLKKRAAEVHLMNLPDKAAETNRTPYIILQLLTGDDTQAEGEQPDSSCKVRIIVGTYSENDSVGALDVLNVITAIRIALLKKRVVGEQFSLKMPLEYLIYDNDSRPYFFGEIMSIWEMPAIEREVIF
ncbi:MAG: hypothetical protein FWE60_03005 [Oscillospiraceae bacterium]|nr:hypothetical protein [Oscillospiraceae bacterium]